MNINITSRKFRAKDTLKSFINDQLKSLEKYNDEILEADVILSFTHMKDSIKDAEVILKVPGQVIAVSESSDDFMKSISSATDKLARKLKKVKTKKLAKKR